MNATATDLPWFPFYVDDYLGSEAVCAMDMTARGVYTTMLAKAWRHGSVPTDLERLARVLQMSRHALERVWPQVAPCWEETSPGRLTNPRQEEERAKALRGSERHSTAGKAGAAKRWGRDGDAIATPSPSHAEANGGPVAKHGTYTATSTAIQINTLVGAADPSLLLAVWNEEAVGLPKAQALTPKRRTQAAARLRDRPSLEEWRAIVRRLSASPFCRGEGDRGWRATFDFLLRPDTAVKVLEGQYDRGGPAPESDPEPTGNTVNILGHGAVPFEEARAKGWLR